MFPDLGGEGLKGRVLEHMIAFPLYIHWQVEEEEHLLGTFIGKNIY